MFFAGKNPIQVIRGVLIWREKCFKNVLCLVSTVSVAVYLIQDVKLLASYQAYRRSRIKQEAGWEDCVQVVLRIPIVKVR